MSGAEKGNVRAIRGSSFLWGKFANLPHRKFQALTKRLPRVGAALDAPTAFSLFCFPVFATLTLFPKELRQ